MVESIKSTRLGWTMSFGFALIKVAKSTTQGSHNLLPLGVGRVAGRQPGADVEAGLVGGAGRGQITGGLGHVSQPIVADREVTLPLGVARVGVGTLLDRFVDRHRLPGCNSQVAYR